MATNRIYHFEKSNPFVLVVIFALVVLVLIWVAKSIFKILSFIAPVLLIATLFINYRVIVGYGRWLAGLLKRNPLFGILAVIFSIIGFPVVAAFLLIRALSSRGVGAERVRKKGEYIRYEEVNDDFLDLSDLNEHKKKMDNDYNDVLK